MTTQKKMPVKLFILAVDVIAALTINLNLSSQKMVTLLVKDNNGTSFLETVGDRLVCIFQHGQAFV